MNRKLLSDDDVPLITTVEEGHLFFIFNATNPPGQRGGKIDLENLKNNILPQNAENNQVLKWNSTTSQWEPGASATPELKTIIGTFDGAKYTYNLIASDAGKTLIINNTSNSNSVYPLNISISNNSFNVGDRVQVISLFNKYDFDCQIITSSNQTTVNEIVSSTGFPKMFLTGSLFNFTENPITILKYSNNKYLVFGEGVFIDNGE